MKKYLPLLFFIFHFSFFALQAQNRHIIDSLQKRLQKFESQKKGQGNKATLQDTIKADILYGLAKQYWITRMDTARSYGEECLKLSEEIGYKRGMGNSYNVFGIVANCEKKFEQALEYDQKALEIRQSIGDKKGVARSYNDIANIYQSQYNYAEALQYHLKGLNMSEELGDTLGVGVAYVNIGNIFLSQGNYSEGLKNYQKGLLLFQAISNQADVAASYGNMGIAYYNLKNYDEALKCAMNSFRYNESVGDEKGLADCNLNLGTDYMALGKYTEATYNIMKALDFYKKIGAGDGMEQAYIALGEVYEKQNNLSEALKYETLGVELAIKVVAKDDIIEAYSHLAEVNAKMGNYTEAYNDEVLFKKFHDTLFSTVNEQKLAGLQFKNSFDKKQDSLKADQVKKNAVNMEVIKRQTQIRNAFIVGFILVLIIAGILFNLFRTKRRANVTLEEKNKIISNERDRSDALLLNILPSEVAEELKAKGSADAKQFDEVTVIFTDFKSFTAISEKLTAKELVAEIDYCFKGFDNIIHKYGIEKIKTIGDSYMAAGGLPVANKTHAGDVVNAALEIVDFMEAHKQQRIKEDRPVFEIRIGINTGPVVAGIVGVKKFAYDIWGDTVNLASRMESSGEPGKVNISGSTYELIKNDFACTYRGKIQAKNKGGVDMYFVG